VDIPLTVLVEPAEDGWFTSWVAEIPGAISQGQDPEEAVAMALDAAREISAARRDEALKDNPHAKVFPGRASAA
jgi:predicted RNase H-like HicB family nuclease